MSRRARTTVIASLLVGALLTWTGASHAAEGAAESLFRGGREALGRGDYARACALLRESERLEPAPGTELNLAICEEHLGNLVRAWQLLQELLHTLPETDERAAIVRQRAALLDQRVARLVFEPAPNLPAGTRVLCNGTEYTPASFGLEIPVDPGSYAIEVRAPGRRPRASELRLVEGERRRLRVDAGPAAPEPEARATSGGSARTWGIVTAGAGAAALTAGVVLGLGAERSKQTMERECDASGCSEAGLAAADRGEALSTASTATFLTALAAGATSAVIFLTTGGRASAPRAQGRGSTFRFSMDF